MALMSSSSVVSMAPIVRHDVHLGVAQKGSAPIDLAGSAQTDASTDCGMIEAARQAELGSNISIDAWSASIASSSDEALTGSCGSQQQGEPDEEGVSGLAGEAVVTSSLRISVPSAQPEARQGRPAEAAVLPPLAPAFEVGEDVLYWSDTWGLWVQTKVEGIHCGIRGEVLYNLTCRPGADASRVRRLPGGGAKLWHWRESPEHAEMRGEESRIRKEAWVVEEAAPSSVPSKYQAGFTLAVLRDSLAHGLCRQFSAQLLRVTPRRGPDVQYWSGTNKRWIDTRVEAWYVDGAYAVVACDLGAKQGASPDFIRSPAGLRWVPPVCVSACNPTPPQRSSGFTSCCTQGERPMRAISVPRRSAGAGTGALPEVQASPPSEEPRSPGTPHFGRCSVDLDEASMMHQSPRPVAALGRGQARASSEAPHRFGSEGNEACQGGSRAPGTGLSGFMPVFALQAQAPILVPDFNAGEFDEIRRWLRPTHGDAMRGL
eukprot:CAMPEP_0115301918 /NCGR_PEP_ID=MMETSP0270-20121206/70111_1 /TAXON_ID=71861 /ORGANISM="Scrippsiella trochoidea, Strain CCMP3099" /LENGTH=486 /DNA_ID=CAMNT_0002719821 /DNA_START=24 /DNA_END=1484 /DNA_ORIENTATION=-